MKDNSFEKAMNKIVGQHEAEQQAEIRAQKRSKIFSQIRGAVVFLALAGVLAVTYIYRDQLSSMILPKPAPLPVVAGADADATNAAPANPQGQTASVLKTAQQNAATRDAIIDSIAK